MEIAGPTAARWYLAALIDGEGSAYFAQSGRGARRAVTIHNTDEDILDAGRHCLRLLGVEWTEYKRAGRKKSGKALGDQEVTVLTICQRDSLEILSKMPMQSQRKLQAIKDAVASYRDRPPLEEVERLLDEGLTRAEIAARLGTSKSTLQLWIARIGRTSLKASKSPAREDIVRLYVEQGMSLRDTADALGVSFGSLPSWMDRYGISRRRPGRTQGVKWSPEEREQREKL